MNFSDRLIRDRERQGVRNTITGKIIVLSITVIMQLVFSESHAEAMMFTIFSVPMIGMLLLSMALIRRRDAVAAAGIISVFVDVMIIVVMPLIWYHFSQSPLVTRGFLLKNIMPVMAFVMLIVNGLALHPRYPLVFSIAVSLYQTVLYFVAIADPALRLTDDIDLSFNSPAVNPVMYGITVGLILLGGIILAIVTRRARTAIVSSALHESRANQLSRYFSPAVAGSIMNESSDVYHFGGREQQVAVMFSDIRNFTRISEERAPQEVIDLLREYHASMVECIFRHGGTVDKFLGDGIMATFGTPVPTEHDAANAVSAALDMRASLASLNARRRDAGLFTVEHGIGIHYGPVIAGNVGSVERLEYTVIGDTVNVASRIESMCKEFRRDILVSEAVALRGAALGPQPVELGRVEIRGKTEGVRLYAL